MSIKQREREALKTMEAKQMMEAKQKIRQEMRRKRESLSPDFISRCEEQIFQRILDFHQPIVLSRARLVMGYSHFKNEVPTGLLKEFCFQRSIDYCLPVTQSPPNMDAWLVREGAGLHSDSFGILTPDTAPGQKAEPENIDFIFIPGLAFDLSGNRLGFGKGYYDHFLASAARALKIALAYDFQVFNQIPSSPWDQKMDFIITEKRLISCSGGFEEQRL